MLCLDKAPTPITHLLLSPGNNKIKHWERFSLPQETYSQIDNAVLVQNVNSEEKLNFVTKCWKEFINIHSYFILKSKFIELVGIKLRPSKEEVKTLQKVDNREGRKNRTEKKQAKRVKEKNETTDKDMRKYFKVKKTRMRNLGLT